MTSSFSRLAISLAAALSAVAMAAAPASARITASASSGRISAISSDSAFTRGGLGFRCISSTLIGTVAADGLSFSGELDFSNGGRTTCSGTFGVSCEAPTFGLITTPITFRSTASTAGVSATGDIGIDTVFTLAISCPSIGLVCTISGTQTIRAAGTIIQGRPVRFAANARGIRCTEGGTADFTGNYTFFERITIS